MTENEYSTVPVVAFKFNFMGHGEAMLPKQYMCIISGSQTFEVGSITINYALEY
jgi:hypothetical protein